MSYFYGRWVGYVLFYFDERTYGNPKQNGTRQAGLSLTLIMLSLKRIRGRMKKKKKKKKMMITKKKSS
jgi:nitrous oxidase accessory protein NosD